MNVAKLVFFSLFFVIASRQSVFGMQDINYDKEQSELLIKECKKQEPLIENIKTFLINKADPNSISSLRDAQRSPLSLVCHHSSPPLSVMQLLIENKADPNLRDGNYNSKKTPLFEIIVNKQNINLLGCVKMLLENRANPCIKIVADYTPLHCLAIYNPSIVIATLFLESQMNPIVKDIPTLLNNFCQSNEPFKNKIFTYMFCLKGMKLKVPKYVNFEIFKPLLKNLLVTTTILEFINTKSSHNTSAIQDALQRKNKREFLEFALFLQNVEEKCKQGYEAYEEYINQYLVDVHSI